MGVQYVPFQYVPVTNPDPVTNAEFTMTLASQLRRPAFLAVPAWFLSVVLGEMARLLVKGQRVIPARLNEQGFKFRYPLLSDALGNVLKSRR